MAMKPLVLYVGAAVATAAVLAGVNYARWSQWQAPVSFSGPREVKIEPAPQSPSAQQPAKQAEQQPPKPTSEQPAQQPAKQAEQKAATETGQPATQQPAVQQPVQKAEQQPGTETKQQQAAVQPPVVAPPMPKPSAEDALSFDIVRVEGDGAAVVAGRSAPGADVVLKLDGKVIGRAHASERGEWVIVPDQPFAKGDHLLVLESHGADGKITVARQSVAIKVPDNSTDKPLIVLSEAQKPSQVLQAPEKNTNTVVAEKTPQPSSQQPSTQQPAAQQQASEQPAKQPATEQPAKQPAQQQAAEQPAKQPAQQQAAEQPATGQAEQKQATEQPAKQPATEQPAQPTAEQMAKQQADKAAKEAEAQAAKQAADAAAKQAAKRAAEQAAQLALKLNSVDYNDAGDMTFAGHAVPGSTVRLYVDNGYVADTTADSSGNWTFVGREKIKVGDHQLRIDSIDAQGKVMARIEEPFARAGQEEVAALQKSREIAKQAGNENTTKMTEQPKAEEPAKSQEVAKTEQPAKSQEVTKTEQPVKVPAMPEEPANQQANTSSQQASQPPAPKVGRVVIQPGNNLWRISRIIYGKGHEYTVIYQANRDAIRNPDLIYPGQIFTTPGVVPPKYIDPRRRRPLTQAEKDAAAAAAAAE